MDRANHHHLKKETPMKQNVSAELSKYSRGIAIAIVASGAMAATAVHANPSNNIVQQPARRFC
jgi:hypothetical protein